MEVQSQSSRQARTFEYLGREEIWKSEVQYWHQIFSPADAVVGEASRQPGREEGLELGVHRSRGEFQDA